MKTVFGSYRSVNDFLVCASRFQLSISKQGAVDRHISVSLTLDHRPHMYSQDTRSQVISPVLLYQQLVYNSYIILTFWPQVYLGASAVLNNLLVVISSVIRYCRYCAHAELFE